MIEPTLADARADPRANGDVGLQADIVSGQESQLLCLIKQQAWMIEKLEARMEEMGEFFGVRLMEANARIAKLEGKTAQPKQKDRGEILIALLAATPHGKMLESEARRKMDMTKPSFSVLLRTLDGDVAAEPWDKDRRKKILRLK